MGKNQGVGYEKYPSLSTVQQMDRIIVLDEGRIAERGTHRDLLELGRLYASMYRRQLLEEELEVDEEQQEHEKRVRATTDDSGRFQRPRARIEEMGQD